MGTYDSQMRITTTDDDDDDDDARARREGEEGRKKCLAGRRAKRVSDSADFKVDDDRYFPSCFFVETYVNQPSVNLFKCYNNTIVFVTQIDRSKYV